MWVVLVVTLFFCEIIGRIYFIFSVTTQRAQAMCVINAGKIGARETVQCVKRFVEQA